jgi:iron complex transport system permease protein
MVKNNSENKKRVILFVSIIIILAVTFIISVAVGSVNVPVKNVFLSIANIENKYLGIIRDIRLPRVIISVFIGASLSVSGILLQSVMQNPMADPGVTGISSGASVMVVFLMLYMPGAANLIPLVGFVGGLLACVMVYFMAWKNGINAIRIILAGVAVNSILGAFIGMMNILNSDKLAGILSWMNGNLSGKSWPQVKLCIIYSVLGIIIALFLHKNCNILALGDKTAKSLGFNPNKQRILISAAGVFLAGIATSFVGIISFVGLMVPHIARLLVGSNHKYLIPFSALLGSSVLMLADTLGRTITAPYEIPVGIVMSVMGGPFFLYLLRKGGKSYGS